MAFYWLYFVICGCLIQTAFILSEYAKRYIPALIFKSAASIVFVALGAVLLSVAADALFGSLVIAGLAFGALGDVLLNLRKVIVNAARKIFAAGIAAFMTGHLLYIAALLSRGLNAHLVAVPLGAVICAVITPFVLKRIDVEGKLRTFGIVYMTVIFLMTACAAGLLIMQPYNRGHLMFAAGAVLFTLSDLILIFNLFGRKEHKSFRALNLSAYYAGQILIALSLLCI